ncbi:MAG: DUF4837 family protein [Rikenellaceae bacterium]|nr:DUF4837 family protein [Rikenellaceae bacterium]MBR2333635.1 DUF4837 family protein [Rikenellaceae bacterium]
MNISLLFKRFSKLLVAAFVVVGFSSCDAFRSLFDEPAKPGSKGAAYELVVVCGHEQWQGEVGDTLRSVLLKRVEMLNQREPYYDVLRVTPDGFLKLNKEHRNVLIVNINPSKYDTTLLTVQQDVYANNQVVLTASAPTDKAMVELLDAERENLLSAYEVVERRRNVAAYEKFGPKQLTALVKEKFGFTMHFPSGFTLARQTNDFIWTRYEMPRSGQGVLVYSYPYTGPQDLSEKNIIAKRNKYAALVPGPSDGSYMTTYYAESEAMRIDGRLWIRTRGFWEVANDFMGGPFVSYTTIDTQTNKVVTIDGYVFSPELHKRNYVREMEHLVYTVKFDNK